MVRVYAPHVRRRLDYDAATVSSPRVQRTNVRAVVSGRHLFLMAALTCSAAVPAGCGGGSSSTATNSAEAHSFALANAICREYNDYIYAQRALENKGNAGSGPQQFLAHDEAELARLRAVLSSTGKLPRVALYISDLAAQGRLLTTLSKEVGKGYAAYVNLALSKSYRNESGRLAVAVAADAKALGLTSCLGPRPRKPVGG